jgi:hypothetical protein
MKQNIEVILLKVPKGLETKKNMDQYPPFSDAMDAKAWSDLPWETTLSSSGEITQGRKHKWKLLISCSVSICVQNTITRPPLHRRHHRCIVPFRRRIGRCIL